MSRKRKIPKDRKRAVSGLEVALVWDAPDGGRLTKCKYCGAEIVDASMDWFNVLPQKLRRHEILECPKRQSLIACPGCGATATEGMRSFAALCPCGFCYVEHFGWFRSREDFESGAPAIPSKETV